MRTRSKPIVTSCDSRSREKDTMSPERLSTSFCSVSRALDPCCLMWTLSPWWLRKFWRLSSWRLAWRDDAGHVVLEVRDLRGDGAGQEHADARDDAKPGEVDDEDGQAAGEHALEQADDRGEDERDHGRDHEDDEDRAGRAGQRPETEQGEREHHELDPAGDDHRRDRRRPLRMRAVVSGQVSVQVLVPVRRVARVGAGPVGSGLAWSTPPPGRGPRRPPGRPPGPPRNPARPRAAVGPLCAVGPIDAYL